MYNNYLTSVGQFPKVFTVAECHRLINLPLPATDARINVPDVDGGQANYQVRRTRDKAVPPYPEHAWIFQRIGNLVTQANQHSYRFHLNQHVTAHVLEYSPDGFYDWHIDLGADVDAARKISVVTFLTPPEEYEGGELCFMDQGPPLKLPQGTTVLFPSYLIHKVQPVTRGTRFTLVSWVHGPSFC
jgi:PKHD-type hydroxylase